MAQVKQLMENIHNLVGTIRIERPPLDMADTASRVAKAVTPPERYLAGHLKAQRSLILDYTASSARGAVAVNALLNQSQAASLHQAVIDVCMHGS
jgi:hypothetical protein